MVLEARPTVGARLVAQARIEKFNIKDTSFDIPKQTINACIKSDNKFEDATLEVISMYQSQSSHSHISYIKLLWLGV